MTVILVGGGRAVVVCGWCWAVQVGIVVIVGGVACAGLIGGSGFAELSRVAGWGVCRRVAARWGG